MKKSYVLSFVIISLSNHLGLISGTDIFSSLIPSLAWKSRGAGFFKLISEYLLSLFAPSHVFAANTHARVRKKYFIFPNYELKKEGSNACFLPCKIAFGDFFGVCKKQVFLLWVNVFTVSYGQSRKKNLPRNRKMKFWSKKKKEISRPAI